MDAPRPYGVPPPGFRLPDATHVGAVHLQIGDLDRSLEYYEGAIGLRVLHRDASSATLGSHGGERPLVHVHAKAGVQAVSKHGVLGLYHFAILLPDRAHLGRFTAHLMRDGRGRVGMADHLVSEALYLWDPDGLGIEVYADRPRETWRHRDRELVMAADPLDTESLIGAGGGTAWEGMPAGTTMGHVHLHVGDLPRAEGFYHAALGLEKTAWTFPGALFMSAGGYHHHLAVNTWSRGSSAREDQARLLEWELLVPDAQAAAAAAESLQSSGRAVEDMGTGWRVTGPWGTVMRIQAG